ncbi:MAG: hypothetical protein MUF42_07360 [Cytophagaceae bacterium]|nr:hypothetical protein [Cytophagaceae bacterium]
MADLKILQKLHNNGFYWLIATVFFCSCNKVQKDASVAVDSTYELSARLRPSNLYKADSVAAFIRSLGTQNQEKAIAYMEKSKALRDQNPEEAIYQIKKALTLYPETSWYKSLAELLMELNQYNEAHQAYSMYLLSEEKPGKEEMLSIIKAAMLGDRVDARYAIGKRAQELGATAEDIKQLVKDPEIQHKLTPDDITDFLRFIEAVNSEADTSVANYAMFLSAFKEIELPLQVNATDITKHTYSEEYFDYDPSKDYSNFLYERLEQVNYYPDFDYKYTFRMGNYRAVVYSADTSAPASLRQNRCIIHRLCVYSSQGELLSSYPIGIHAGEQLVGYEILPNATVRMLAARRVWKNPFTKNDMANEVLQVIPTDTLLLSLDEDGLLKTP